MKLLVALAFVAGALVLVALRPRVARAEALKEGDPAPDFSTQMVTGDQIQPVKLSDFRGKRVVLYFYPKDFTSGCTKEACAFRDGFARFQSAGAVVLGCSIDSSDSHRSFIKKYSLPFPLLLDHDKSIARAYGAANGIPILGLDSRITYVIDTDGKILKMYPKVDPGAHPGQILEALASAPPVAAPVAATPAPGATAPAPPAAPADKPAGN
jgi:thioredoxin-dependent peroxiredoxin